MRDKDEVKFNSAGCEKDCMQGEYKAFLQLHSSIRHEGVETFGQSALHNQRQINTIKKKASKHGFCIATENFFILCACAEISSEYLERIKISVKNKYLHHHSHWRNLAPSYQQCFHIRR